MIDATGLKVYGAGEWHVQKHRSGRRRAWRKLHLGVDETTKEIVAVEVTKNSVHDSLMLPPLLEQIPGRVHQVSGDGAYDTRACYEAAHRRGAQVAIPPRRNAVPWEQNADSSARMRNKNLRLVRMYGRYEWRVSSGCTRQSLAENAFSRFKALFGGRLAARRPDNQYVEVMVKCAALNRMTGIGMPESILLVTRMHRKSRCFTFSKRGGAISDGLCTGGIICFNEGVLSAVPAGPNESAAALLE